MGLIRILAAIIVGLFIAGVVVGVTENMGHLIYPPPEEMRDPDNFQKLLNDPPELQRVIDELPFGAIAFVLLAWQAGAIFGGATAALIAPKFRVFLAGIIGFFILLASVGAMIMIPHPMWMKIAGLLLPLPCSLIAGKIVSMIMDSPEPSDA